MIVTLTELKEVLGLDVAATDEDTKLTRLINAATESVEGMTKRRFREPIARVEYRQGHQARDLYLAGNIDDVNAVDSGSDDPALSLVVSRRTLMFASTTEWEELTEGEDYERRKNVLLFLRAWYVWPCEDEFKIEYLDGFTVAPEDVRAVVLEIASTKYLAELGTATGTAGVTSETLGDFSYGVDLAATPSGRQSLSEESTRTIQRYKRKFV